jgi:hypothetical protein
MKKLNIIFVIILLALEAHGQGTLISISGPVSNEGTPRIASTQSPIGVSWTTTSELTNVNIFLGIIGDPRLSAMAYLTTNIGPGTTTADQVAATSFYFPATSSLVRVFSGLTLVPGTYYLTVQGLSTGIGLDGPFEGEWVGIFPSVNITDPSISLNGLFDGHDTSASYPPADQMSQDTRINYQYQYMVTGYAVPEPSTLSLLGIIGMPVFLFFRRKLVVLITDAPPSGFCDSGTDPNVPYDTSFEGQAHQYALKAATNHIKINAICIGDINNTVYYADAQTVMQDYAATTCGWYSQLDYYETFFEKPFINNLMVDILNLFYTNNVCQ